ncbi:MAG: sugar ABC transporter ATP-binding protein [Lachnospiraceae bacterium]|nr:sugar ABC transporter ATP-binding protein [Lachnospiraceae bacterium]
MQQITKRFPGVLALDQVNISLDRGEVLALVGENGAGKSTLLKILSGAYVKDEGVIEFDGRVIDGYSPNEAIDMGISIIYQELDNYGTLTVTENILVNALPRKGGKFSPIDWKAANAKADELIRRITDEIDVTARINTLTAAQQQLVEIAKAMSRNMKVLVMDEPTSALNRVETEQLLKIVKNLAAEGIGIIYISHRMDEIFQISDRIQVMRDGKSVSSFLTSEVDEERIVREMVGRTLDSMYPHTKQTPGECILKVEHLTCGKAEDVSFRLHRGEILSLFGLMGAGRTSMVRGLFGDRYIRSGSIEILGKTTRNRSPKEAIQNHIAYVPNERKLEGLMLTDTVRFNISISVVDILKKFLKVDKKAEEQITEHWIEKLGIRTPSGETKVVSLSGGNQQKVVIARWLETKPEILILNDPTRGIDVGAKAEIYRLMEELCWQGMGIIMISSELQETLSMADRILVMSEGRVTGEVPREEATQENLMKLAVGGKG